ncbi:hypothetical protein [Nocardia sp. NPDC051570]|uniref:hypothetical protein n=1 Tax=Nocardia sp. NPDC051570 TaxID=3364324 RepID=UPI0037919606
MGNRSVRAAGLSQHTVGAAGARAVAAAGSLTAAERLLPDGPCRRAVRVGASLIEAEHAVAATVLWQLRVLAARQPWGGARMIRSLAGGFEGANIVALASTLDGAPPQPIFDLGALDWAWTRVNAARSLPELRVALRKSAWGEPGGDTVTDIADAVAVIWAARVAAEVPPAASWAAGAMAYLVARRQVLQARPLPQPLALRARHLLGSAALRAADLPEFVAALPVSARWALVGLPPDELRRAVFRWWARIERDGRKLLSGRRFEADAAVGTAAILAADAWRVRVALQIAAGVGTREDFDELIRPTDPTLQTRGRVDRDR